MTIPQEAVVAAQKAAWARYGVRSESGYLRTILEAAAPHILAEREAKTTIIRICEPGAQWEDL